MVVFDLDPSADDGVDGVAGLCGGLHGHGFVDSKGNVYLPRSYCGRPYLAISRDEGVTWENVLVSKKVGATGNDPNVTVDDKGVIFMWDGTSKIVTFEPDREIAWTIEGQIKPQIGHVYGYTLDPTSLDDGTPATLVTSYYDWSSIDPSWKEAGIFPVISEGALRATLGILARTVARGLVIADAHVQLAHAIQPILRRLPARHGVTLDRHQPLGTRRRAQTQAGPRPQITH